MRLQRTKTNENRWEQAVFERREDAYTENLCALCVLRGEKTAGCESGRRFSRESCGCASRAPGQMKTAGRRLFSRGARMLTQKTSALSAFSAVKKTAGCESARRFSRENAEGAEKRHVRTVWMAGKSRKSPRSLCSPRFNPFVLSSSHALLEKGQTSWGSRT